MSSLVSRWSFSLPLLALLVGAPALAASDEVKVKVSGYVQPQYEGHSISEDEVSESGGRLNHDRFLIRRARLRMDLQSKYLGGRLELSGGTSSGSLDVRLHRAEAHLQYRPDDEGLPGGQLVAGLTKIPFGHSLADSSTRRFFMERPLVVRSLFPGSTDLGAVLHGDYRWFNLSLGLMNGQPRGGAVQFAATDPNSAKDFLVRLGAGSGKTSAERPFRILGNVSFLTGTGFSPGEVQEGGPRGPSSNFDRWAASAAVQLEYRSSLGASVLEGEVIWGENMDRNFFATDPVVLGTDTRQVGWYVALTQEVGENVFAGLRYDVYEPDARNDRRDAAVPSNMRVQTISPVIGVRVLDDRARLTFEYDFVRDDFDPSDDAAPADLVDDVWTLRLQMRF